MFLPFESYFKGFLILSAELFQLVQLFTQNITLWKLCVVSLLSPYLCLVLFWFLSFLGSPSSFFGDFSLIDIFEKLGSITFESSHESCDRNLLCQCMTLNLHPLLRSDAVNWDAIVAGHYKKCCCWWSLDMWMTFTITGISVFWCFWVEFPLSPVHVICILSDLNYWWTYCQLMSKFFTGWIKL